MKGTIMAFLERFPLRLSYPAAGFVLALGAPVGYFIIRSLTAGLIPSPMWIEVELRERLDAYVYLACATAAVFMWLGRCLGVEKDRLRADSLTDPLTNLPNRRLLQDRAEALLFAPKRRAPVSLLFVDLDGLKLINQERGHEGGDRALCAVATTLTRVCRRGDVFARYGGDEFVVLLPNMGADEALSIAERICETMTAIARTNGLGPLSVSIGVTDIERAGSNTLVGMVQAADRALLAAKLGGKNRARLSEPLAEGEATVRQATDVLIAR